MNILWLFVVFGIVDATFDCVNIFGTLKCNKGYKNEMNVKIEIFDDDYIVSELMGISYAQNDGTFAIFACGADSDTFGENFPDPYMKITHTCGLAEEKSFNLGFRTVFAPQSIDFGVLVLDDGLPIGEEYYYLMHQNTEESVEISSNFNDFDFGIKNKISAYGDTISVDLLIPQTTSTSSLICGVLKKSCVKFVNVKKSPLNHHIIGYDDLSAKVYIRAEVRYENLNKGADMTEKNLHGFRVFSCKDDIPEQYITKKIGGIDSALNVFPRNPTVDMEPLINAIEKVYDHVNNVDDENENSARLMYIMNYVYQNQNTHGERPSQIYFHFKLYKNGEFTGEEIEGKIENPMPPPMIYPVKKQ